MSLPNYTQTDPSARTGAVFCFSVRGVADPGMMPRLMELWAKRGLVPDRWYAVRSGIDGAQIDVDIEAGGLDVVLAAQLAASMRAIFGVALVLVSEKRNTVRG